MRLVVDIVKYYAYFIVLLIWAKVFFILINYKELSLDFVELPRIWWHALRLDLSLISYTILPLILLYGIVGNKDISRKIFKTYMAIVSALIILILSVDPFFYKYWGSKVNLLFVQYIGEPGSALSSIEGIDFAYCLLFILFCWRYAFRVIKKWETLIQARNFGLILVLVAAVFFGRGGFGMNPIGISAAYYHHNAMYNNAALNPVWNLIAYEMDRESQRAVEFISEKEEQELLQEWRINQTTPIGELVYNDSSKIYLIVLESFTNKVSQLFSGSRQGYTPHLDELAKEGLYYTSAYSSSFRSDRGLTALLSGMPSLATQSLTNRPELLSRAPNLFKLFRQQGWHTSFHYGGNLDFANLRVLVNDADLVKEQADYSSADAGAWGFHDELVFKHYLEHAQNTSGKSFHMVFSSSSHEPFKVPNFNSYSEPYENSIAYTDSCLGVLIDGIKETGDWENLLIVITADHGTILPERSVSYKSVNFNVPIILAGGLLRLNPQDSVSRISTIVSQFDIPRTLAKGIEADGLFTFSHSLLQPKGAAFYNYYNGIVYVSDSCKQFYDIPQKKYLHGSCAKPFEQAYFQAANKKVYRP